MDANKKINNYSNFLRISKIDELPQLFNVLRGELSLVGPRPLHYEYKNLYKKKHMKRFDIIPGITGWSQIHSIPRMSWSKKFFFDTWYVKNKSFFLDLAILIITFKKIFFSVFKKKIKYRDKKFNGSN